LPSAGKPGLGRPGARRPVPRGLGYTPGVA